LWKHEDWPKVHKKREDWPETPILAKGYFSLRVCKKDL
jgi:hypothetical protein